MELDHTGCWNLDRFWHGKDVTVQSLLESLLCLLNKVPQDVSDEIFLVHSYRASFRDELIHLMRRNCPCLLNFLNFGQMCCIFTIVLVMLALDLTSAPRVCDYEYSVNPIRKLIVFVLLELEFIQ